MQKIAICCTIAKNCTHFLHPSGHCQRLAERVKKGSPALPGECTRHAVGVGADGVVGTSVVPRLVRHHLLRWTGVNGVLRRRRAGVGPSASDRSSPGIAHRYDTNQRPRVGGAGSCPLRFRFWSKDLRSRRLTASALAASSMRDLSLFLHPEAEVFQIGTGRGVNQVILLALVRYQVASTAAFAGAWRGCRRRGPLFLRGGR